MTWCVAATACMAAGGFLLRSWRQQHLEPSGAPMWLQLCCIAVVWRRNFRTRRLRGSVTVSFATLTL